MTNLDDSARYYNKIHGVHVIKVYSGDCYTSASSEDMMVTVLGSCIAACIRDPLMKVGGMNHFLLPDSKTDSTASNRYGSYAMEQLINDLLKKGADRSRLEVKIFGGGNVIESSAQIGDKNVSFIKQYLKDEGLKASTEDLGGNSPRRIHYYPVSGKVMMKKIDRKADLMEVQKEEEEYKKNIDKTSDKGSEGDVELF